MLRIFAAVVAVLFSSTASAEPEVRKNVVYGMYSGLALLMDVHTPDRPNGLAVVLIPGSGFHALQGYDAVGIKDGSGSSFAYLPTLLDSGFTVFVVNHRAAPRFRYPAAIEDLQRAVRFIRHHATDFNVRADRVGAIGYSSGGYLATMLGVLDGEGAASDPDPINRLDARVQAVVANASNADLQLDLQTRNAATIASFMGMPLQIRPDPAAAKAYREASPVTHVSRTSAPLLLIHGDADDIVTFRHAEILVKAANQSGATVTLIRVPGGSHGFGAQLAKHPEWPDVRGEAVRWLNRYLNPNAK